MRETPVEDYLEEFSTTLPGETYGYLSDAIYETNVDFDQEIESYVAKNAKLTKLARWMYQVMDESCAVRYPYEPAPVSIQALIRAEKELQALGIEVPS